MEKITRKEVFECALALYANIINTLNNEDEKLYDYALILQKGSSSPVICLNPYNDFEWNGNGDVHGENTYAFIPVLRDDYVLKHCGGVDHEYHSWNVTYEKFNACQHPCPWIRDVIAKQYMKLSYIGGGRIWKNKLEYDSSWISKIHSTWICAKVDDIIVFIPYYNKSERDKAFNKLPGYYTKMTQEFWE